MDDQGRQQQGTAGPRYSPDGKYFWDGHRWVPVQEQGPSGMSRKRRRWPWVVGVGTAAVLLLGVCTAVVVYESRPPPPQQTPATLVITQWVKDPAVVDGPWPGYRPQISAMQPKMVARVVALLDPNAGPTPDPNGSVWLVDITLNAEGTRLLGALTKNAVAACSDDCPERHIAWWLELSQDDIDHWNERASADYRRVDQGGKLVFDPRVGAPITDGTLEVGDYTDQEAHILVRRLGGR